MVIPIAFYLIRSERYSKIHAARTTKDQMRLLYLYLTALEEAVHSRRVKSDFYRILLDLEPDVVIDLGAIFVDIHKYQLIQKVTNVKPILHELFYKDLYCNTRINQMTSQDQMRLLYQALEEAEDTRRVKLDFYRILLDLESNLVRDLDKLKIETVSSAGSNWTEDSDFYEVNKNLTVQLDKVTIERDELKGELKEVKGERDELKGELKEVKGERDELKGELKEVKGEREEAREIQSLSTSPGGQQETQTPSQKSKRIDGMEMKSLPEKRPLLAAGPQNDDLDEMERGGRVTIDNNSML
ncbi:uncharacterized protein LOC135535391 [Oncorhynchus masou masou]|uniref:uncharacterized protein LOC135535391 n=1 Tax=Oncorhynchus masou masou TaxID=90313 RepID=UPI0031838B40